LVIISMRKGCGRNNFLVVTSGCCSALILILCLDAALKVMLLVLLPPPADLRGAAAGPSCDLSAQGAEQCPMGQIWGQCGPTEATGGFPQIFSWRRGKPRDMRAAHMRSSPRSRVDPSMAPLCGLMHEGGSGGRLRWDREAGEGLMGWLMEGHGAWLGPGRVWVAPGTARGSQGDSFLRRGEYLVALGLLGPVVIPQPLLRRLCWRRRCRSVLSASAVPWFPRRRGGAGRARCLPVTALATACRVLITHRDNRSAGSPEPPP